MVRSVTLLIRAEDRATPAFEAMLDQIIDIRYGEAVLEQFAYRMGQEFKRKEFDYDLFMSFSLHKDQQNKYMKNLMWKKFLEGKDS
jgi:hypothetical protein